MSGYSWSSGDQLNASDLSAIATSNLKTFTAGGTINASSTPKAVYLKASDGKVYVADASADESTYKFIGYVANGQNLTAGQTAVVTIAGYVSGFTGLTQNAYYYLGASGAISTTPDSTRPKRCAFAVSTTAIFIVFGQNIRTFSDSLAAGFSNTTHTITVGFRARLVTGTCEGGSGGGTTGTTSYFSANELSQLCTIVRGHIGIQSFSDRIGVESDANPTDFQINMNNFTETGFDIVYNRAGSIWSTGGSVQAIAYGE